MAVCCQNLPLSALSSCSAPTLLVGALFIKFGLFLNTPHICDTACVMSCVIHAMQAVSYPSDEDAPYSLSCDTFDTQGTNSVISYCASSLTAQLLT